MLYIWLEAIYPVLSVNILIFVKNGGSGDFGDLALRESVWEKVISEFPTSNLKI